MQSLIKEFTDLIVWQKGHQLVLQIYQLSKSFPGTEAFCLTSQMRRAAISITSNIAEGFGRRNKKEKIQFYCFAQGSVCELANQIRIAKDIGYLSNTDAHFLLDLADSVTKLLSSLITKNKNINPSY